VALARRRHQDGFAVEKLPALLVRAGADHGEEVLAEKLGCRALPGLGLRNDFVDDVAPIPDLVVRCGPICWWRSLGGAIRTGSPSRSSQRSSSGRARIMART
jgi:hypothetical protein